MKRALIAVEVLFLILLGYLSLYLATDYQTPHGRHDMPFVVWIIDTIDLFIHEGGHGIFRFLGQFMHFLGGSLIQFIIPVTTIVVFLRTSGPRTLMATLYWLGQNMINVSIYIADAPKQQLTLISRHAMHDWRWLCGYLGIMDSAGDLAAVVAFLGTISLLGAVGVTVYYIVFDIRAEFFPPPTPKTLRPVGLVRPRTSIPPVNEVPPEDASDGL
ncbi:MAG: hypothetical protein NTU47_03015 [Ignavibacteriales bacterium]|nr:hypothetical protein [Ignavibacteriales bacterium]